MSKNAKTEVRSANLPGETHEDACSPFCQCSCCAGFSITHHADSLAALQLISTRAFCSYLPHNLTGISLPIWEPPQL